MLGKLTKYEFRATGRTILIFYAALLILSVITGIGTSFDPMEDSLIGFLPTVIVWMLYAAAITAVLVLTLLLIIQRFYKNMFQNEGYLMHTLPVKPWQHVAAKLIAATVWSIASGVVIFASMLIIAARLIMGDIIQILLNLPWSGSSVLLGIETCLMLLAGMIGTILTVYLSMAIGQLSNRHRLLCSFGAFIAVTTLIQIIEGIGVSLAENILDSLPGSPLMLMTEQGSLAPVHALMIALLIYNIVKAAVFFAGTAYLMKKRLNLE